MRALVVSIVGHAALITVIALWPTSDPSPGRLVVETAAEPMTIEAGIDVAVMSATELDALTDPIVTATIGRPSSGIESGRALRSGARPGASGADSLTEHGPGLDGPEPTGMFKMRGMRHDLSLSGDAMAKILEGGHPLVARVEPTGKIQQHGAEGRIDDLSASYVVHGDGTMSVRNKKDFDIHWRIHLPRPAAILRLAKEAGEDLAAWYEDPYRDSRAGPTSELPNTMLAIPGACQRFGDVNCDYEDPASTRGTKRNLGTQKAEGGGTIVPIAGGKLDIIGYLHRKYIGDPYASRKLKILDSTRAERVETGTIYRAKQLERSAELMARNLAALWKATQDPTERKQALFELWDECVEADGAAGAAGDRARAMVIGWIGSHLPRGQLGAYSVDDIARFEARRTSMQHFAPY